MPHAGYMILFYEEKTKESHPHGPCCPERQTFMKQINLSKFAMIHYLIEGLSEKRIFYPET